MRLKGGYAALISDRYHPHCCLTSGLPQLLPSLQPISKLARSLLGIHDSTRPIGGDGHPCGILGAVTLSDAVVPEFAAEVEPMLQQCEDFGAADGISTVEQVYQADFIEAGTSGDWDSVSPWGCYFEENSLVSSSIPLDSPSPTLIITAENDDLALPAPVKEDILSLCDDSYVIEHRECVVIHVVQNTLETVVIAERVQGNALESYCEITHLRLVIDEPLKVI